MKKQIVKNTNVPPRFWDGGTRVWGDAHSGITEDEYKELLQPTFCIVEYGKWKSLDYKVFMRFRNLQLQKAEEKI